MRWYPRSTAVHDTPRGHVRRGWLLAMCGVEFTPQRALLSRRGPVLATPGGTPDPSTGWPLLDDGEGVHLDKHAWRQFHINSCSSGERLRHKLSQNFVHHPKVALFSQEDV